MTQQDVNGLLKKYHAGQCTDEELRFLAAWYNDLEGSLPSPDPAAKLEQDLHDTWNRLNIGELQADQPVVKKFPYFRSIAAAVAVVLAVGAGYYMFTKPSTPAESLVKRQPLDIPAGSNKAILTLAGGQRIVLDSASNGTIAQQNGVRIVKNQNGQVVYDLSAAGTADTEITFNTISTPNGGQYQLILPDGSMVFLNAASSLKFPTRFTGPERKVELKGEGYFEVAKDARHRFIVSSSGQQVTVLGTHFNVSAYAGEAVRTTLAEGSVKVTLVRHPEFISGSRKGGSDLRQNDDKEANDLILKPGQQAILSPSGGDAEVRGGYKLAEIDADDVTAWKDGLFIFSNTELKDVFKQLARWYNVEVDYATVPDMAYEGEIPRNVGLLKVLALIEATSNVGFKLEGRRIMRK